jgi:membrane-bound inhibitor of C-type lysozyme
MKYIIVTILGVAALIGAAYLYLHPGSTATPLASVTYSCDNDHTIAAVYYEGPVAQEPAPGEPPTPTGSVTVSLDDGPQMTLSQTLSASGIRYANTDESFVFWSKGDEALVMRNNEMDHTYTNCRRTE